MIIFDQRAAGGLDTFNKLLRVHKGCLQFRYWISGQMYIIHGSIILFKQKQVHHFGQDIRKYMRV